MLCELSQVHGHLPGFQVGQLGGFLSLMAIMRNCSSESVVCPFHTMLGVLVLRVSCLCLRCLQDNTVTLGLVDTIDTVMGHISSNLQSREPHVTLTGSSSMAGSPSQIGGGSVGVVEERVSGVWTTLAFTLSEAHTTAETNHHFSKVQCLVEKSRFWKQVC